MKWVEFTTCTDALAGNFGITELKNQLAKFLLLLVCDLWGFTVLWLRVNSTTDSVITPPCFWMWVARGIGVGTGGGQGAIYSPPIFRSCTETESDSLRSCSRSKPPRDLHECRYVHSQNCLSVSGPNHICYIPIATARFVILGQLSDTARSHRYDTDNIQICIGPGE